ALMRSLLAFLKPASREHLVLWGDPAASEQRAAARPGGPRAQRTHQVLIVDDEAGLRTFCRHVLQADGIQCEEAINGFRGVEAPHTNPIGLVFVDVDMPVLTGLEALKKLREAPPCPHLKIIMISGHSSADEMARMLVAGADDYLTKPFSLIQLQGRVKAA